MCRRLKVFPKGESDEKGKSLTVFLELLNCERFPSNRTLYAKFKLRILDQLHDKYYEKTVKAIKELQLMMTQLSLSASSWTERQQHYFLPFIAMYSYCHYYCNYR
jgi:hypothetical protein